MILWLSSADNTKWARTRTTRASSWSSSRSASIAATPSRTCASRRARSRAFGTTGRTPGRSRFASTPSGTTAGLKTIFGKRGRFDWEDACRLCLEHPRHRSFLVLKLWSYFIPTPPSASTQAALQRLYVRSGYDVSSRCWRPSSSTRPSTTARAWSSRRSCSSPGCSGPRGRGVDSDAWAWLGDMAGQHLFQPPNVAGWDESRWLDTATFRGRWWLANYALERFTKDPDEDAGTEPLNAAKLVDRAAAFWGSPTITRPTRNALTTFARRASRPRTRAGRRRPTPC